MVTLIAFLLAMVPITVKEHGIHGRLFSIEEEDLLEHLKKKAQGLTSHEISEKGLTLRNHYKKMISRPMPITLKEAMLPSIHYFDPTVMAKQEIKDGEGNMIIAKGDSYNPLHYFSLSEELLFFNGDDLDHLEWAKSLGAHKKWILTAGRPTETEEKENRPVYFDQYGLLTQKLKIVEIPAHVSQEGSLLKIETIPIERKR